MRQASVSLFVASLGLAALIAGAAGAHSPTPASPITVTRTAARHLDTRFALIDQNGAAVSDAAFRGTPRIVYFGYTQCADACPLDAQKIAAVVDRLNAAGVTVAP